MTNPHCRQCRYFIRTAIGAQCGMDPPRWCLRYMAQNADSTVKPQDDAEDCPHFERKPCRQR